MAKDIKLNFKIDTTNLQKGVMFILRGLYQIEGLPFGDTEEGFMEWLLEIGIRKTNVAERTDIWE